MKRRLLIAVALAGVLAGLAALAGSLTGSGNAQAAYPVPHPTVTDFQFIKATTPTEARLRGRRADVLHAAGDPVGVQRRPAVRGGLERHGASRSRSSTRTAATRWRTTCTCSTRRSASSRCAARKASPARRACRRSASWRSRARPRRRPPAGATGTQQEDKSAWALEVALDVETSHAIAPMANILLVTTPNAETLGVQGFPQMMKAEDYVVEPPRPGHLAELRLGRGRVRQQVVAREPAATRSRTPPRTASPCSARRATAAPRTRRRHRSARVERRFPFPTVEWPASDPLVTGVGGTYLCTDPTATTDQPRTTAPSPAGASASTLQPGASSEVAWTFSGGGFSHVFSRPSYQNALPAGSTPIRPTRVACRTSPSRPAPRTGALVYLTLPPDGQRLICSVEP